MRGEIVAKVPWDMARDKMVQTGLKMKGFATAFGRPYKSHFWGSSGVLPGQSWVAALLRCVGKGDRAFLTHICVLDEKVMEHLDASLRHVGLVVRRVFSSGT